MPCSFKCGVCGRKVSSKKKMTRIELIRRHYKRNHPRKFREMIKKGARTRRK